MTESVPQLLGSVVSIAKGKKHETTESPSGKAKRLIGIDDLRNNDLIRYTDDHSGTEAIPEDVLIAWDGANAGTIGYGKKGYIGSTISRLRVKSDARLFTPFLGAFLKSKFDYLRQTATGATIPHISRKALESIPLPNVDFDDQIRIAHLLGKVEGLIAQRKQHLQQLDDLLKSVFLEMFGNPVRNEKGWDKAPLEKFGSVNRGVSKHRPRNEPKLLGGKYPLIQTGEVSNAGTYITTYTQTYSDIGFAQSKQWPSGTLCITIAANIAQTGILTFAACFPDSVVGFIANKNEANPLYVHGLFWFFQAILEKNAPAAAQKNINLEILRGLEVPKPPVPMQNEFATIVEKIEGVKSRYQHSLTDFEALYGALSQQAFKGELDLSRVPMPEEEIKSDTEEARETQMDELTTTQIELPDLPTGMSLSIDRLREEALRYWLEAYWTALPQCSIFKTSGLIDAINYRLTVMDDQDREFDKHDHEVLKTWVFECLDSGRLSQSYDDTQNIVVLRRASSTSQRN